MTAAHERPQVVAVDVGGTSIKGARVDADGLVAACHAIRTPVTDGPTAVITAIRALVQSLLDPSVVAVGLVVPGDVDGDAGIARYSANLGWRDVPLRQVVGDDTGLPTVLAHDVHAAALAEREIGVARDLDDVVVVAIGTGIAAVSVCAGREVDGAAGLAGEIGHLAVVADGEPCPCGQRGCWSATRPPPPSRAGMPNAPVVDCAPRTWLPGASPTRQPTRSGARRRTRSPPRSRRAP